MNTRLMSNEHVESKEKSVEKETHERAIRAGAIAAFVSASITALLIVLAPMMATSGETVLSRAISPWNFVDVGILAVLGILVLCRSRIAATFLMIYFVADTISLWSTAGEPVGLVMRVILFSLYFAAVRGTYRWHRLQRQAPDGATQP